MPASSMAGKRRVLVPSHSIQREGIQNAPFVIDFYSTNGLRESGSYRIGLRYPK